MAAAAGKQSNCVFFCGVERASNNNRRWGGLEKSCFGTDFLKIIGAVVFFTILFVGGNIFIEEPEPDITQILCVALFLFFFINFVILYFVERNNKRTQILFIFLHEEPKERTLKKREKY